jgi:septum formation topological specificity factor MinE
MLVFPDPYGRDLAAQDLREDVVRIICAHVKISRQCLRMTHETGLALLMRRA